MTTTRASYFRNTAASGNLNLRYDLKVNLLPDANRLQATGTVQLPATANTRDQLQIALSELMGEFRVQVLQPIRALAL